mgnify:FL=1
MVINMKVLKKININKDEIKVKLSKYSRTILDFLQKHIYIIYMALPFLAMDIITRIFGKDISFYSFFKLPPNLFTITWIFLFLGLTLTFKKRIGRIIYFFTSVIFLFIFLTNNVYYSLTKTYFDFNLVESASEGAPYIIDTLKNTNFLVYLSFIFIILLIIKGIKSIPYKTKNNYKSIFIVLISFTIIHTLIPITLGKANSELTWSSWRNPRNVYISFNDNNKSMKVSGIYEYTVRNFYITFFKTEKQENSEDIEFLDNSFADDSNNQNKYTGIFKGKNVIFIQLEGLDNWLLTEETTPTLYNMLNNSIVFNNHYSYYNGGGSTFNSEFAVNTGFITPLSYTQNAYTFNKNNFPYSMAHLFKKEGYTVNAFHMNTGEYYSRTTNYKNWGYDNYYGLIDIENYKDETYRLDRNLILNEKFNNLIFHTDDPDNLFVDYLITYSGHLPFTNTKGVCKMLYDEDVAKSIEENTTETNDETSKEVPTPEFVQMSELECIKRQAKETDYMFELLLQNLEEKGLIDNTILVVFTDHYLYTIEDKSILDNYKDTSNNLINKTPFFIWSKDGKRTNINKVTSQLNILPTTLNLFGINYNSNNYIGKDALDPNYEGIVFFSDYSWYDGSIYVENGEITNNKDATYEYLEEKNYYISYLTKKNDLALKYNYFKNHK